MDKKTQEELERPAKVYQVDAIHTELIGVRKLLEEQTSFIKTTVTSAYLEERLKTIDEKFEAKIEAVQQEYRPVLGNARWVAKTAIGAFLSIILMVIGIYLKS